MVTPATRSRGIAAVAVAALVASAGAAGCSGASSDDGGTGGGGGVGDGPGQDGRDDSAGDSTAPDGSPSDGVGGSGGPVFIIPYGGDTAKKDPAGLFKVTPTGGAPTLERLTGVLPVNPPAQYIDIRGGRVAMLVADAKMVPAGRGPVMVFDLKDPTRPWFAPLPPGGKGTHYEVHPARPQVLADGRIVLALVLQTDVIGDDYHGSQLALWDPKTDAITGQGVLDSFVLGQPEIASCKCDPDAGELSGAVFAVSPDGKYAYFAAGSYGTDAGMYHEGPKLIGRWDLASKVTERVVFTGTLAQAWGVSADGTQVVIVQDGKFKALDTAGKTLAEIDPYGYPVTAGQFNAGDTFVKGWRGCTGGAFGGVAVYDIKTRKGFRAIDGEKLKSKRGLDAAVQVAPDGKAVYFTASADTCTNFPAELSIMKAPTTTEATADAVEILKLDAAYYSRMLLLVQ